MLEVVLGAADDRPELCDDCRAAARRPIAALYVQTNGAYFGLTGVDTWDEARDARLYSGPNPVVAHPPCARWCRLAKLVASRHPHLRVGDDGGCFSSALAAVREFGGVLEHPAWSMAWAAHDLIAPDLCGWTKVTCDVWPGGNGWVCEVAQSAYGHRATKATWLYYVGNNPPAPMRWDRPRGEGVVSGMRNNCGRPLSQRVWAKEASRTPVEFRDALILLARNCDDCGAEVSL